MAVILVLEDEIALQRLLARVLQSAGYEVITAASADEAMDWGRQAEVTLMVADVNAPGAPVRTVVQTLRERHGAMKVLFVSGHDRASLAGHGIPAAADFLQKPFSPAVLVTEVQRLLGPACPGA